MPVRQKTREYLMLCRGRPNREGFRHKACRIDALARITYAGLAAGSTLHFIFEDCTMLCCAPALLEIWVPWGGNDNCASEPRLLALLEDVLRKGISHKGIEIRVGKRLTSCVEDVMTDGPVGGRSARFAMVAMLRETGCPLYFDTKRAPGKSTTQSAERILVVLGGVRDLTEEEEIAVEEACHRLGIAHRLLALGHMPELTSKCIKAVEVAGNIGFLGDALRQCAESKWKAPKIEGEPLLPPMLRLHMVYVLQPGMRIVDFACRFEAAVLIVDVFRASHSSYDDRTLTLVDSTGCALSFRNRDLQGVLKSEDAINCLKNLARRARRSTLAEAISTEFENSKSQYLRLRRLLILNVDPASAPLRRPDAPCFDFAGGEPTRASMEAQTSMVTVVFSHSGGAALDPVLKSCRVGVAAYLRASLGGLSSGGLSSGPAFISMLHNEGLLAPTIDPSLAVKPLPRPAAEAAEPKQENSKKEGAAGVSPPKKEVVSAWGGAALAARSGRGPPPPFPAREPLPGTCWGPRASDGPPPAAADAVEQRASPTAGSDVRSLGRRPPSSSSASSAAGGPPSSSSASTSAAAGPAAVRAQAWLKQVVHEPSAQDQAAEETEDDVEEDGWAAEEGGGIEEEGDEEEYFEEEEEEENDFMSTPMSGSVVEEWVASDDSPLESGRGQAAERVHTPSPKSPGGWHVSFCVAEEVLSAEDALVQAIAFEEAALQDRLLAQAMAAIEGADEADDAGYRQVGRKSGGRQQPPPPPSRPPDLSRTAAQDRPVVVRDVRELEQNMFAMQEQREQARRTPVMSSDLELELHQKAFASAVSAAARQAAQQRQLYRPPEADPLGYPPLSAATRPR